MLCNQLNTLGIQARREADYHLQPQNPNESNRLLASGSWNCVGGGFLFSSFASRLEGPSDSSSLPFSSGTVPLLARELLISSLVGRSATTSELRLRNNFLGSKSNSPSWWWPGCDCWCSWKECRGIAGESGGPEGTTDGAGGLRNSHVRTRKLSSIYQWALIFGRWEDYNIHFAMGYRRIKSGQLRGNESEYGHT